MEVINLIFLVLVQRVGGFSTPVGEYDLSAKQTDDGIARFFAVGDWGGLPFTPYETPSEVAVAKAMGKLGVQLNTSFQLALGDNFYFEGVKSPNDPRFDVSDSETIASSWTRRLSLAHVRTCLLGNVFANAVVCDSGQSRSHRQCLRSDWIRQTIETMVNDDEETLFQRLNVCLGSFRIISTHSPFGNMINRRNW